MISQNVSRETIEHNLKICCIKMEFIFIKLLVDGDELL